ncbi:MAG: hypothetical protein JNL74_11365, partial [Fibrobacteres bacterium]|nr:hypothetical protein [Fibrobacterota bacterium]
MSSSALHLFVSILVLHISVNAVVRWNGSDTLSALNWKVAGPFSLSDKNVSPPVPASVTPDSALRLSTYGTGSYK